MPTLVAALRISEPKGGEKSVMNWIKRRDSQITADVDNILQSVGRHQRGVRESETFLLKSRGTASYLRFERSRRTGEYIASLARAET
jgi:hypothetical protein